MFFSVLSCYQDCLPPFCLITSRHNIKNVLKGRREERKDLMLHSKLFCHFVKLYLLNPTSKYSTHFKFLLANLNLKISCMSFKICAANCKFIKCKDCAPQLYYFKYREKNINTLVYQLSIHVP